MTVDPELLKTACYFTKLEPAVLEKIRPFIFIRQLSAGEVFIWEDDESDAIYFAISGLLKLFTTSSEGREFIVRLVYGGDSFNDDALFDKGPSILSAMTISRVMLYGLRKADLNEILRAHPQVASKVAEVFAARQSYFIRLARDLVFKNVTSRLAHLLLDKEKLARAGENELKVTQQEMASMIGTVREIVSRSLRELEAMGAISLKQNQLMITDREQLLALSQG